MTVYYLTGEGGLTTDYLTDDCYALKYVSEINATKLYGTDKKYDAAKYLYTTNRTVATTNTGAGRSFYRLKASVNTGGTLPWTQQYTLTSGGFDPACDEMKLSTVSLTTDTGGIVPSAREAMKIAEYKETPQEQSSLEVSYS